MIYNISSLAVAHVYSRALWRILAQPPCEKSAAWVQDIYSTNYKPTIFGYFIQKYKYIEFWWVWLGVDFKLF